MMPVIQAWQDGSPLMDPDLDIYARVTLALGIGLMVGVERGWRTRERPEGSRAAGIRTFTLIGLFGGLTALPANDAVLLAGFAGVLALLVAAYVTGLASIPDRSITGEVAALTTYVLGALAVRGDMVLAAAGASVLVVVLASREQIHAWIKNVERVELKAAIQLLVISVVILPVLPNRGYGPGAVLNPFELWWMVVAIAGISFIAMAAVKWLGARAGLLWTGLLGGLASSTAVAVSCARLAKDNPSLMPMLAVSVGAATSVKFLRSLLVASIIYPAGARTLAPSLIAATVLAGLVVAILAWRTAPATADQPMLDLGKVGDLTVALSFAAILCVVSLAGYYANIWFGGLGVMAVSGVTGLVDVDAVTVSTARQAVINSDGSIMAMAVPLALTVNTLAKLAYIALIAGRAMALRFGLIALAAVSGLAVGLLAR
jgi:uncharacterized membrane protein (DUF4010 family)